MLVVIDSGRIKSMMLVAPQRHAVDPKFREDWSAASKDEMG